MTGTQFSVGTFDDGHHGPFPGIVVDGIVHTVPDATNTMELLADWDTSMVALQALADASPPGGRPVGELSVLAPVQPPGQIFGAGANYREHVIQIAVAHRLGAASASDAELREQAAREIDERAAHGDPYVWVGVPSAISGPYDDVILPDVGENHDWELELGVIIGKVTRGVSVEQAMDSIAGYTICNDVTTRSLVGRADIPMMGTDWLRAKNQPTFYPTGPYLVPARFVPDPSGLDITLRLNGETMQRGVTGDMIFGPAALIAYLSRRVTYLIRDRDGKYPTMLDAILADAGIAVVLSGVRMPRMNSIMERWIQSCRHELLDRTLIWNQAHLLRLGRA